LTENVATKALRGLSNALKLVGARASPPGIELGLPSQPIHDLTPYARYGSAPVFDHLSDGWVTFALVMPIITQRFQSATIPDWSAVVSDGFGISLNELERMALWVYDSAIRVTAEVTLADVGDSLIRIDIPTGFDSGLSGHIIFLNQAGNFVQQSDLEAFLVNEANPHLPFMWPAGQLFTLFGQNTSGIPDDVTFRITLLCRLLPLGVPPLP